MKTKTPKKSQEDESEIQDTPEPDDSSQLSPAMDYQDQDSPPPPPAPPLFDENNIKNEEEREEEE